MEKNSDACSMVQAFKKLTLKNEKDISNCSLVCGNPGGGTKLSRLPVKARTGMGQGG
jgi:hypothetical protein